jgi:prepilin-type N-terminal cleavage/methylation domain-containing protein
MFMVGRNHVRAAFTLVELLVVIAIIGILVALLLPAIQAAREAARRVECNNHLKQFGIGFQNHHDTYKFFPTAGHHWSNAPDYDSNGTPLIAPKQRAGWGFQVLPFIEQEIVWNGNGGATVADQQKEAMGTTIATFFCPSRRSPEAFTGNAWYGPGGSYAHAQTDYAASNHNNNGVVVRTNSNQTWSSGAPITTASITDGTTNTMVVGEKRLNVLGLGRFQSDDNEGYTSGWDHDVMRYTDRSPRPDPRSGDGNQRFGSSHPGGFQGVFADGAVRFISFDIQLNVFHRMGQRNDGGVVSF